MNSKRSLLTAAVTLAGLLVLPLATPQAAAWAIIDDDDSSCDGGGKGYRLCEVREITLDGRRQLEVDGRMNGGISVTGWERNEIRVRARVQAWARQEDDALELSRRIELLTDGAIRANGPEHLGRNSHSGWAVSYDIMVPKRIDLSLETMNGGVSIEGINGEVRFQALNGGVHLRGLGGDVRGATTNGGLVVDLEGNAWDGAGLEVKTTNGGVKLSVPEEYSAELTTGTVNGRLSIDFPVEVGGEIKRKIVTTLGRGGAPVRVTTTNGSIKVRAS